MKIDDATLDKLAKLAKLKIDEDEREKLKADMTAILSWVDKLEEVDTDNVEPILHMTKEVNRVREDENNLNLPVEEALKNASLTVDNYFVVPKVIKSENE